MHRAGWPLFILLPATLPAPVPAQAGQSPAELANTSAVEVAGDLARLPSGEVVSLSRNQIEQALGQVVRLQGNSRMGCGLLANGGVRCWQSDPPDKIVVRDIEGLGPVRSADGSPVEGCAARTDGTVICWQRDDPKPTKPHPRGEMPTPDFDSPAPPPPLTRPIQLVSLPGIRDAVAVVGGRLGCALRRGGGVSCWGYRWSRAGGSSPRVYDAAPRAVPGLRDATQIADGLHTRCALTRKGEVRCWGMSLWISLTTAAGLDDMPFDERPRAVPGISDAVAVAVGDGPAACAVKKNGRVSCWGTLSCALDAVRDAVSISLNDGICATRRGGGIVCQPCTRRRQP